MRPSAMRDNMTAYDVESSRYAKSLGEIMRYKPCVVREILAKLGAGKRLSMEEAHELAIAMLRGAMSEAEIAAALTAMRVRGEEPEEVAGFAKALRETCVRVRRDVDAIDTAGTGGDGASTINASTAAALVAAAAGAYVLKHGNRGVTSPSGSADLVEALGIPIGLGPEEAARMLAEKRFAFLFAPNYHPAIKAVMPVRRTLPFRTIFNLAAPLANPGLVERQVVGVAEPKLIDVIAKALSLLGTRHSLVIHGEPGIDEASPSGKTEVAEVRGGSVERYTIDVTDLGAPRTEVVRVGNRDEAVERVLRGLRGVDRDSENFIAVNAALALYVAGAAKDPRDGYELARKTIEDGEAIRFVESLRSYQPRG